MENKLSTADNANKTNIKVLDIPIDFLSLQENRILPAELTSHLPQTTLSKTKSASSYNMPSDPRERVHWVFSLFKSKPSLIKYAKNAPPRENSSLDAIADYLNSFSEDVLEKYMLIFTWIAFNIQYDTGSYFSRKIKAEDCSADAVFRNGCGVCSGYSTIFGGLCAKLNLSCLAVNGYAKGFSYRKGAALNDTNHEWNLVELGGEWFLIETTWASGKVGNDKQFKFDFNPFYFFCPPQFYIEDHLPVNPAFQLLERPFEKSQFEAAFLYKLSGKYQTLFDKYEAFKLILPEFFVIDLNSHLKENEKEFASIKIKNVNKEITASLTKLDNTITDKDRIKFENRVFIKKLEEDEYEILYQIPSTGDYEIHVFERNRGDDGSYRGFISYFVHAKNVERNDFEFVTAFPFADKCELIEPYSKFLKKGSKTNFKLMLANYESVAVIQDKVWSRLQRNELTKELWEGEVEIKIKEVKVFAQKNKGESFSGLFEYEGI